MNVLTFARCALIAVFLGLFGFTAAASETADQRIITKWVAENSHKSVDEAQASRIVKAAYKAAKSWDVDPLLLLAFMKPESNFRAKARNPRSNASCLMQVIPRWHREKIGNRQIMNVETCVDVGAAVIAEYLSLSNGKLQKAVVRYRGLNSKTYYNKIAQIYREMKTALVLDRFESERGHNTDHIFQQPGAYTASLIADRPKMAYVKNPDEQHNEVILVASHP